LSAVEVISIAGSMLSFLGVLIAISQIRKTRRAAEAAQNATDKTQKLIARNVLLQDISACTTAIEEVKALIRSKRYEASLLRVTDLNTQLIRLRYLKSNDAGLADIPFQEIVTQMSMLREMLEQSLNQKTSDLRPAHVNGILSRISDQLNAWIGKNRYVAKEGASND